MEGGTLGPVRGRAWWGLVLIGAIVALFGVGDLFGGISADPAITLSTTGRSVDAVRAAAPEVARLADLGVRVGGATLLVVGVLWILVAALGVRRGVRWTWWAMWTMPAYSALVTAVYAAAERAPDAAPPPPLISGPIVLVLSVVILLAAHSTAAARRPESVRHVGEVAGAADGG
jgi:hypothetical protein